MEEETETVTYIGQMAEVVVFNPYRKTFKRFEPAKVSKAMARVLIPMRDFKGSVEKGGKVDG